MILDDLMAAWDATRAACLRYWRVVDVFVGVVMRGTLRLLERTVHDGAVAGRP